MSKKIDEHFYAGAQYVQPAEMMKHVERSLDRGKVVAIHLHGAGQKECETGCEIRWNETS